MVVVCAATIGKMTMIVIATEEMTAIAIVTEEMMATVTVTDEMIMTVIVTDEMNVLGREVILVVAIMMILSRPEPLVVSRIRVPVAARIKVSNREKETPIMAFP